MNAVAQSRADDTSTIRPFHVDVPESELIDLRQRINATRWPERETVTDSSQGVPLATLQKLAHYWGKEYDWRKFEARLNAVPNYITGIDGVDIHFVHVRSKHENALPLLVSHGWPGSIAHNLKIIEPLTNPTAHGGTAADAFHVVLPSMPGYGFSGKPAAGGWDSVRVARAWSTLMNRLGYERYVAQGGDWGSLVVDQMGVQAAPELIGIHSNLPAAVPAHIDAAALAGVAPPPGLSADETHAYEQLAFLWKHLYYAFYMGARPQTLTGLADSPVFLASFMSDFDPKGLALIARVFDGQREGLSRDDVLDNISLFWLTNTGVSAARFYWENKLPFFVPKNVRIPVAVSVYPEEQYQAPRSWVEKAYPNLVHYNKVEKGGHFPAWEQPKLFVDELRAGFRTLRA